MKFIATLKIYITIFALVQFSFSSKLESNSRNKVATESKNKVASAAKAESKAKTELKNTANSVSSLKTELKTELKAKTELKSKTELKTELNSKTELETEIKEKTAEKAQIKAKTESKSTAGLKANLKSKVSSAIKRSGIIDLNNIFNPTFNRGNKDSSKETPNTENEKSSATDTDNTSEKNTNNNEGKKPEPPARNTDEILADWLMISSQAFHDKAKFPDIYIRQTDNYVQIHTDSMDFRKNDAHEKDAEQGTNVPKDQNCFWFRLSGLNIYYSSTVSDINILGSISIMTVVGLINLENDHTGYFCFIIKDNSGVEWKICSEKMEKRNTWVCAIQATLGVKQESFCNGPDKKEDVKVIDHNVSLIHCSLFSFIKIYFILFLYAILFLVKEVFYFYI